MTATPPIEGFQDLVRRARGGDRDALDAAIARTQSQVEGLIQAYADAEMDAPDLLAKATRMAWRRRRRIPVGDDDGNSFSRFREWLGNILHRLGRRRRMSACIDGLRDPTARAIIRLRFLQGLSLKRIARRLDRDLDAIQSEYRSAMRELEDLYYQGPDPRPKESRDPGVDERIHKVAGLFWEALHAGEGPDPESYLNQYADLGHQLGAHLRLIQKLHENRLPEASSKVRRTAERIQDALSRLPDPEDASILRMHLLEGVKLTEIAKRLGKDYRRVRERYRRAIRLLQEEIGPIL